jgi:hypothetical protein
MKTKLAAALMATLMMMGLFGAASATADPGPNDKNNKGLCTAYFNGSERGQEQKRKASPFAALEREASDGDDSTSPQEDVAAFCDGLVGGRAGGDKGTPGGGKP